MNDNQDVVWEERYGKESEPKSYPWQQKEDGTIAQTLSDMQDVGVSVFTQTAAEWNQKIHDEQNSPRSGEIRLLEMPVIHTGFFGYIKNWLGIV